MVIDEKLVTMATVSPETIPPDETPTDEGPDIAKLALLGAAAVAAVIIVK